MRSAVPSKEAMRDSITVRNDDGGRYRQNQRCRNPISPKKAMIAGVVHIQQSGHIHPKTTAALIAMAQAARAQVLVDQK